MTLYYHQNQIIVLHQLRAVLINWGFEDWMRNFGRKFEKLPLDFSGSGYKITA